MPTDDEIIQSAMSILRRRFAIVFQRDRLGDTSAVGNYFVLRMHKEIEEHFDVMFLDEGFGVISVERLASGTKGLCHIYQRNVVKRALERNATHVLVAHNHSPFQNLPSPDDIETTVRLKTALESVDVSLADHVIVSGDKYYSMREHGDIG